MNSHDAEIKKHEFHKNHKKISGIRLHLQLGHTLYVKPNH